MVIAFYEITTLKNIRRNQMWNQKQEKIMILKGSFQSNFPGRLQFSDSTDSLQCSIVNPRLELFQVQVCILEWQLVQSGSKFCLEIISARPTPPELESIPTFDFDSTQVNFYKKMADPVIDNQGIYLGGTVLSKSAIMSGSDHYLCIINVSCIVNGSDYQSFIIVKSPVALLNEFTGTYVSLLINSRYYFNNMRTTKIKNINTINSKKPVLMFECGKSKVYSQRRLVDNEMPRKHAFLAPKALSQQSQSKQVISYQGEITKIIDPHLGMYELDNHHHLVMAFHGMSTFSFRVGAILSLNNVHLSPKDPDGAYLVPCSFSDVSLARFSTHQKQDYTPDSKIKKEFMKKYNLSNFQDFLFFESIRRRAYELNDRIPDNNFHLFVSGFPVNKRVFVWDQYQCLLEHETECKLVDELNAYPEIISISETLKWDATQLSKALLIVRIQVGPLGNLILSDSGDSVPAVIDFDVPWIHVNAICVISQFLFVCDEFPPVPDTSQTINAKYVRFHLDHCTVLYSEPLEKVKEISEKVVFYSAIKPQVALQFTTDFESELVQYVQCKVKEYDETNDLVIEFKKSAFNAHQLIQEADQEQMIKVPRSAIKKVKRFWTLTWTDQCRVVQDHKASHEKKKYMSIYQLFDGPLLNIDMKLVSVKGILKAKYPIPSQNVYRIHQPFLEKLNGEYAFTNTRLIIGDPDSSKTLEVTFCCPVTKLGLVPNYSTITFDRLALHFNDRGMICGKVMPITRVSHYTDTSTACKIDTPPERLFKQTFVHFYQLLLPTQPDSRWISCIGMELYQLAFFFRCPRCSLEVRNDFCQSCNTDTDLDAKAVVVFEDGLMEFTGICSSLDIVCKLLRIKDRELLLKFVVSNGYAAQRTREGNESEGTEVHRRNYFEQLFYSNMISQRFHLKVSNIATNIPENAFRASNPAQVYSSELLKQRNFKDLAGQTIPMVACKRIHCFVQELEEADLQQEIGLLLANLSI